MKTFYSCSLPFIKQFHSLSYWVQWDGLVKATSNRNFTTENSTWQTATCVFSPGVKTFEVDYCHDILLLTEPNTENRLWRMNPVRSVFMENKCMFVFIWSIHRPVLCPANTSELSSVLLTTTSLSWADCTSGNLLMKVGWIVYIFYLLGSNYLSVG